MFSTFKFQRTESGLDFDIDMEPDKKVYCLIGENGVGKTSLLETWAQVVWYLHCLWRGNNVSGGRSFRGMHLKSALTEKKKEWSFRVAEGEINGKSFRQGGSGWQVALADKLSGLSGGLEIDRPVIFIASTNRIELGGLGPADLQLVGDVPSIFMDSVDRNIRATLRKTVETATVSKWIAARLIVNPHFVVGLQDYSKEVLALCELLQEFDGRRFQNLAVKPDGSVFTPQVLQFNISYQNGALFFMDSPIDRLASGYIAVIKIFQEIVSSVAAWEAIRGSSDIRGSDALIFIDEVDTHLHPKWQERLVPFLKSSFPNATFVITTHSPLVVRGTEEGEAYELVLKNKKVQSRKIGSPRDWYLSEIFREAFHVDLPLQGTERVGEGPPILDVLVRYADLVKQYRRTQTGLGEVMTIYHELNRRLSADDPRRGMVEDLRRLLP